MVHFIAAKLSAHSDLLEIRQNSNLSPNTAREKKNVFCPLNHSSSSIQCVLVVSLSSSDMPKLHDSLHLTPNEHVYQTTRDN